MTRCRISRDVDCYIVCKDADGRSLARAVDTATASSYDNIVSCFINVVLWRVC